MWFVFWRVACFCCIVLYYVVLCCVVLRCVVLCCVVLCCAVLCSVVLCCVLLCSVSDGCVGLTGVLLFRALVWFRCCLMVLASSSWLLPVQDRCCCFWVVVVGFIWLLMFLFGSLIGTRELKLMGHLVPTNNCLWVFHKARFCSTSLPSRSETTTTVCCDLMLCFVILF